MNVEFFKNWGFNKFLSKLSFINDGRNDQQKTSFIYCDPPYLGTNDTLLQQLHRRTKQRII